MRPFSDKEMEIVDLDQLFDFEEYVETDALRQYSDFTDDRSSSNDLAHLFEPLSTNKSAASATSTILDRDAEIAWRKALQDSEQNPASSMSKDSSSLSFYGGAKEKDLSESLLEFTNLLEIEQNQLRSVSQPCTPRLHTSKSIKKATSFQNQTVSHEVFEKSSRKNPTATFTKMMQPSYCRTPIPDVWTRKMDTSTAETFGLRVSTNGVTSPPPISKFNQYESSRNSLFSSQDYQQRYAEEPSPLASPIANHPATMNNFANYQLTPQASPAIGIPNNNSRNDPFSDNMGLTFSSSSVSSAALSALQTPPSSLRIPMTTWGPGASSHGLDFQDFSASPDFAGTKTAGWWDNESTQSCSTNGAAPHRESNSSRSESQGNLLFGSATMEGLGITCDNNSFVGDLGVARLGINTGEAINGGLQQQQQQHAVSTLPSASFDAAGYNHNPQMYSAPPPQHHIVPIGRRPISRTPSPSQPYFHRRRPSPHAVAARHRNSTHSVSRPERRKSSTGSSAASSRKGSSGSVGFVNFTPHDSRKILTGVAPSGSSKTKARREKEAAEKRRKLGQAAVKAVMEAGGDVDSLRRLEREGLLVLES
ncbi:hypothetical protein GQ44DRAFT_388253 [Phaeosphaeriaceae sp. PMI808]|nr:hypothetical protein GQ44DRAFT_388253 [Phaeosphaeriaceae sp. PMI808]